MTGILNIAEETPSSPSLPADTVSVLALVALVLSHGFTVLAGLGMYRTAQWQPSYLHGARVQESQGRNKIRALVEGCGFFHGG